MKCRICRRRDNLKYSLKEITAREKDISNSNILSQNNYNAGNICFDCDDRLANFDKISDQEHIVNGNGDVSVIVDDDELLFNLFFKRQNNGEMSSEIIEVLTSGENSPEPQNEKSLLTIDLDSDYGDSGPAKFNNYNYIGSIDVSSESEIEVGSVEFNMELLSKSAKSYSNQQKNCEIKPFRDLKDNEYAVKTLNLQDSLICPECNIKLSCSIKVVQHMRTHHRTYTGDILREQPKSHNDSAMTIRLKYLSCSFYECNICGQIHYEYHIHRQHIKTEHAEESKRLKDPTVIFCPLCHKECETHPELCLHLRKVHPNENSKYLKKVEHKKAPQFNSENQTIIEKTSQVFRLFNRDSRYYECTKCSNFTIGYINHWRHLRKHVNEKTTKEILESNSQKLGIVLRKCDAESSQIIKTKSLPKCSSQAKEKTVPSNICFKKTRMDKKRSQQISQPKLTAEKINFSDSKTNTSSKNSLHKTVKKITNQTHICKYCLLSFTSYIRLNLHFISTHPHYDYHECKVCARSFADLKLLERHLCTVHYRCNVCVLCNQVFTSAVDLQIHNRFSHRQKFRIDNGKKAIQHSSLDENKNLRLSTVSGNDNKKPSWLSDLMRRSSRNISIEENQRNFLTHQCPYCTRLHPSRGDLHVHERIHELNGDFKMIKKVV